VLTGISYVSSELLLRGHEGCCLLVKALEFIVKLTLELSSYRLKLILLGAVCLHFSEFFFGSDGLAHFRPQHLAPIALLPEAIVDVVTGQADPVSYSLRRCLLNLCLVTLGLAVKCVEFVYSSLSEVLD
jgi:hypothetical protein